MESKNTKLPQDSRRDFMKKSALVAGGIMIVPRHVLGGPGYTAPSDKLLIAGIGVGGKGESDLNSFYQSGKAEIAFLCDVDDRRAKASRQRFPKAKYYKDYRELFDKESKNFDAVSVSTPDHNHAVQTMAAMERGKHVYVQKPLTHDIYEARKLTEAASEYKVVTQMGNQGASGDGVRKMKEWYDAGIIGDVEEVYVWTNRPVWPQGVARPAETPTVPDTLNWDLWLGVAPDRPFHDAYQPFNWRGWYDFGAGALGDMGAHIIDPPVWALELGPALTVAYEGPEPMPETFPEAERIHYTFAGTKHTVGDQLKLTWHDGDKRPDLAACGLPADFKLAGGGSLYIGENGTIVAGHGSNALPSIFQDGKDPGVDFEVIDGVNHYQQWINAIRGMDETTSDFAYAGPLTETVLLGTIVCRFPGEPLAWDPEGLKFENSAEATALVKQPYREGWEVEGLV